MVAGGIIKAGKVLILIFNILALKPEEETSGNGATRVKVKLGEMFGTVIDDFIELEKEIGFVTKQLSGQILILVSIELIAKTHGCENSFDEILESLLDQYMAFAIELMTPSQHTEVILEILSYFRLNQLMGLYYSFIDGVEVD
jgi:hypothetical protein